MTMVNKILLVQQNAVCSKLLKQHGVELWWLGDASLVCSFIVVCDNNFCSIKHYKVEELERKYVQICTKQ